MVRDHIRLSLTGPPEGGQEGAESDDMEEAYLAVLVTRHFGAMWVHMRQRLSVLTGNPQRALNQVRSASLHAHLKPEICNHAASSGCDRQAVAMSLAVIRDCWCCMRPGVEFCAILMMRPAGSENVIPVSPAACLCIA